MNSLHTGQLRILVPFSTGVRYFYFLHSLQRDTVVHTASYRMDTKGFFTGVKWLVFKVNALFKNERNFTSSLSYGFMAC
jgi:hypothetical protein